MTITIHKEEDDQRQLKLTAEVSEDRVEQAMRNRARQLSKEIRIPGFRRGKVPYNVVVQRFGRDLIRAEAVEEMVQSVYEEAVEEADVLVYGRPSLDDMQVEPLVVTFIIPLEPEVTLGDYRSLRKEIEEVSISDEAVDEAVEGVQINHQEIESVDRPAESGDVITVGGKGELLPQEVDETNEEEPSETDEESGDIENEPQKALTAGGILFDEESMDLLLDSKLVFPGTEFVDKLVAASAGDHKTFSLTFPDDYEEEDLAGRTAEFDLHVLDVKKRDLPPIDDELAKLAGEYETVDELRDGLRDRLQQEAEDQAKEALIEGMVDDLLEDAELVYPPAAVEMEIDETVETFKSQITRSGWEFDDYMKLQNLSEESLREDFRESSEERLKRRLAMHQFVLDEKLLIDTEDVEALIDERVSRFADNEELRNSMRDFYLSGSGFDMISSEVLSAKVYDRAKEIFSGTAPDLDELAAAQESADSETEEE